MDIRDEEEEGWGGGVGKDIHGPGGTGRTAPAGSGAGSSSNVARYPRGGREGGAPSNPEGMRSGDCGSVQGGFLCTGCTVCTGGGTAVGGRSDGRGIGGDRDAGSSRDGGRPDNSGRNREGGCPDFDSLLEDEGFGIAAEEDELRWGRFGLADG